MRRYRKFKLLIASLWQPVLWSVLGVIVLYFLLFHNLGTALSGLSSVETNTAAELKNSSHTLKSVFLDNPLNLPYKSAIVVLGWLDGNSVLAARAISALFGTISVFAVFFIIKRWHSARIAYIGSALYASSAWFLHTARLATPDSQYLLLPVLCALGIALHNTNRLSYPKAMLTILITGSFTYIPGAVWLVLPAFIWQRKRLAMLTRQLKGGRWVIGALAITILVPLSVSASQDPAILLGWAGFGSMPAITEFAGNLLSIPISILAYNEANPAVNLGKLPYLGIFASTVLVLGIYSAVKDRKLDREKFTLATMVVLSILAALGNVPVAALTPFVFILVSGGLVYLVQQWFKVFPKNPFARYLGVLLIFAVAALSVNFQYQRYYNAWLQAPETKKAFNIPYNDL